MKKILCPLILSVLLSGCFASRFPISPSATATEPTYSDTKWFFLWGLVPEPKYTDPVQLCGGVDRVSYVETETGFWDGLVSLLTLGIVTPRTANVYCARYGYQVQSQPVMPAYTTTPTPVYQQTQWQTPYPPYGTQTYPSRY